MTTFDVEAKVMQSLKGEGRMRGREVRKPDHHHDDYCDDEDDYCDDYDDDDDDDD